MMKAGIVQVSLRESLLALIQKERETRRPIPFHSVDEIRQPVIKQFFFVFRFCH
jgi:hypothetical protein